MIARRSLVLLPMLVAACRGEPGPESFPQPSYAFLTLLQLNVARVEIDDRSTPIGGDQLLAMAPVRPSDALKQMAVDRLRARGNVGRAVFVIDQAWVRRNNGGLDGRMAVHLDIYAGGEGRVGFAEAQVARRRVSTDMDENVRVVLYDFVTQMMADMNVEFEYQVRHSLKEYLEDTAAVAPPPPPVAAQPLAPPVSLPPTSLPPATLPPTSLPPATLPPAALPPAALPPGSGFLRQPGY